MVPFLHPVFNKHEFEHPNIITVSESIKNMFAPKNYPLKFFTNVENKYSCETVALIVFVIFSDNLWTINIRIMSL